MKGRINWIDWAKAIAVCSVVFCHIPQSQEWFYFRYMQATTITVFFFISGYLKKDHGSTQANWKRYWSGLIAPYLLYNALIYPYWFVRYYIQHGLPDLSETMKPVIGALLFEHESAWAEPLNGPLWYLPAILIMHLIIDGCRKTRHLHLIMIVLCIISYFLYAANKQYEFLPNLTPMGLFRRLPYYYLGYVMGQWRRTVHENDSSFPHFFRTPGTIPLILLMTGCLAASLLFFEWHLHESRILIHAALFYPVNLGLLFGLLCFCRLLDNLHWQFVTNLSIGTLVIIGLHIIPIGIVNYMDDHFLGIREGFGYFWYEALAITIFIIILLYPIILWSKRQAPIMIGKNKSFCYGTIQTK